jgi:hypothetical protein
MQLKLIIFALCCFVAMPTITWHVALHFESLERVKLSAELNSCNADIDWLLWTRLTPST